MEGKWVILIVIIATLIGIALAWYFLHTLPNNIKEQSLAMNTMLPITDWFSSNTLALKK